MRLADKTDDFVNPDFVPRSYNRPMKEIAFVTLGVLILIGILSFFPEGVGDATFIQFPLMAIIIAFAGYLIIRKQQHNDLIMAVEFENLLFSAAAALGVNFCIFLKSDGTVVYANDATRRMFPRFSYEQNRALENMLSEGRVETLDRDRLFSALANGRKEILVFAITDSGDHKKDYIIILEPLRRPAGYFVLRGREYYNERKSVVKMSGKLQKTSPEKVATLIQKIPSAAYITNASGTLEFANAALESLLGYGENEIIENKMTIQKMVYHADGYETGEFEPANFIGTVLFKKKDGTVLKAQIDQKLCYDDHETATGCCGIVLD